MFCGKTHPILFVLSSIKKKNLTMSICPSRALSHGLNYHASWAVTEPVTPKHRNGFVRKWCADRKSQQTHKVEKQLFKNTSRLDVTRFTVCLLPWRKKLRLSSSMLLQPAIGVKLHRDGECLKINYNAASKLAALADVPDKDVCEVWPYQENISLKFSRIPQPQMLHVKWYFSC